LVALESAADFAVATEEAAFFALFFLEEGAVAVEDPAAAVPPPWILMTCAAGAEAGGATGSRLPERPISTPMPIASSRHPMLATMVVFRRPRAASESVAALTGTPATAGMMPRGPRRISRKSSLASARRSPQARQ